MVNYRTLIRAVALVLAMVAIWLVLHPPRFIEPKEFNFQAVLRPPPAADSAQTKQEYAELLEMQGSRSPGEIDRARSEEDLTPFVFSEVLGSWFNSTDLPQTAAFLGEIANEDAAVVDRAKNFYGRKRPYVDPRIKPCVSLESSLSYPSGHATRSMLMALVLSEMFPDQRDALLSLARRIGDDRELAGVHFPSDVEAGRTLGKAIFQAMGQNPRFTEQLDAAHAECVAVESQAAANPR